MFGVIRPCRHRLSERLHAHWVAHLCGLCLTLKGEHGQFARTATNYDGLIISALVEAQSAEFLPRYAAGPCPLRGMRRASVVEGQGARLAAAVSLVLASAKLGDHVNDGDGAFRHAAVAGLARRTATRWAAQGEASGTHVGFDTAVLVETVGRQQEVERSLAPGDSVLLATEPTEHATGEAFGYTAVLAGRQENSAPLIEAGRFFGRVAHLLDAVEDLQRDTETGAWNPLTATSTSLGEARRLCDDAVRGVRLALAEVRFSNSELVHMLLVHELRHAVRRAFGHAGQPSDRSQHGLEPDETETLLDTSAMPEADSGTDGPETPPPGAGELGVRDGDGGCLWVPKFRVPARKRNPVLGCLLVPYMCCTCQFCCRDPYPGPWSGKPRGSLCDSTDCGCPGSSSCDCDCGC